MQFNKYTWNLYKQSPDGQKAIKEFEETFLQARSYACLLESSTIVLCDKQCLIIYDKKQSFDRDNYKKYYWGELENPDLFNELKKQIKHIRL